MSEEDLKVIQKYYARLSKITKGEESLQQSHSIDEAVRMDGLKRDREDIIIEELNELKKRHDSKADFL